MNQINRPSPARAVLLTAFAMLVCVSTEAQTPLLQLKAANYNPSTGLWTATVGANAQAAVSAFPTLAAGVTPNGSPSVVFSGGQQVTLATSIPALNGYTVIAYTKPSTTSGTYALCGGAAGSLEYRINANKQDALRQQQADLGSETTAMSTSAFSIVAVTVTNVAGGSYRLNGIPDGANAASVFTQPITAVGGRGASGEAYSGSISEIDIYAGVLTAAQIITVESAMTNSYITVTPTPPAVLVDTAASPSVGTVGGNDSLSAAFSGTLPLGYQWRIATDASGTGAAIMTGQTNTTLVLTNIQFSDTNKFYSLQATNTVSPYVANSSWFHPSVQPLSGLLQVQLIATNYDPVGGVWTDSSGNANNATYGGGANPTLAAFVTPNGSSALNIAAATGRFLLASSLPAANGYSVFAYIKPAATNSGVRYALTGGSASTALEYDVFNGNQDYLREFVADIGHGNALVPTNAFSMIGLAVNSSGATFRFNGTSDGTVAGAAFGNPITRIGNNEGGGDGYIGQIAEIDIYPAALTAIQITNVEAQLTAKYITANSIVIGAAAVTPTNNVYAGTAVTLSAGVIGGTGTTTYQWQTDNGSGGTSFSNIGGATTTNYVLNTTSISPNTYEYQLVGTPFGGSSVTGAPVTLTVQAASAPVVVSDTAANPNPATISGNDTLTASFAGTQPIAYQWQVSPNADGSGASSVTGATNTTLVLSNLQLIDSGKYYSLRATNVVSPYVANSTWLQLTVQPLTALVQLVATNYDPVGGVWTDSSGNGNNASYFGASSPTLLPFVTPNGGSAVNLTGSGSLLLAASLDPSSGYTVFAYVEPASTNSSRQALTGGSAPTALEYDLYKGYQDYLTEYTADIGHGSAGTPTNAFSMIDLAVNASGANFRFNGSNDGIVSGASFGSPITRIGNNEGAGDGFVGKIAEIDIYNGVLSFIQITNIEAQLAAKYVTASSIAIGPTTVSPTNNVYAGTAVTLSAGVIGGTGTTTYQWQTDNGSGGASFANIGGATTTNYALNTTSLTPNTYQYQLVGTPFGGSSVTNTAATLTVQAASAPLVVSDTAANPASATVGGNATLTASFTGTLPIAYQWQVSPNADGSGASSITKATNTTLVLSNLQLIDSGKYYSLRATNVVSPYVANSTWLQLTVQPLTALVQLVATNYDPVGGVWTDSSGNGNNATYSGGVNPTLVSSATPAGAAAVNVSTGSGSFLLTSSLDPSSGYTVLAYVEPSSTSGRHALTGGSAPTALEYDIYNGQQDYLREYTTDVGHGTATIPTTSFSMVGLAANASGASFRLNGTPDGSVSGASFGSPITRIGNNEGGGDGYVGNIAEIDVYAGVLSSVQITNIEAQLTAKYATVTGPTGPASIASSISGGTLHLTWPSSQSWRLVSQTNSTSVGLTTNGWNTVPGVSDGSANIILNPTQPVVFYRLVYP